MPPPVRRWPAVVALLVVLGAAAPAAAHDERPGVTYELAPLPPALADARIAVLPGAAAQVAVDGLPGRRIEVLDSDGEPFLRIGPDRVEADFGRSAWYLTNDPTGSIAVPDGIAPGSWTEIAAEPAWRWYDHRLHPEAVVPAAAEAPEDELARFAIPVRVDGEPAEITGRVGYFPPAGAFVAELRDAPEAVTATVLQGAVPAVYLAPDGRAVGVAGAEGEPFLRFDGAQVQANVRSPSWIAHTRASGATPEQPADAAAPPEWEVVNRAPGFGWSEPRAAYDAFTPPQDVVRLGVRTDLLRWEVPVTVDGGAGAISGVTAWVPTQVLPDDEGANPALVRGGAAAAALAAVGVAAAATRRSRRRGR